MNKPQCVMLEKIWYLGIVNKLYNEMLGGSYIQALQISCQMYCLNYINNQTLQTSRICNTKAWCMKSPFNAIKSYQIKSNQTKLDYIKSACSVKTAY